MVVEVNGVFEGGGSKGLMYIGALEAARDAGLEFRAVAGSSAGAITSMLVACGYTPEEIKKEMPAALATLGSPRRAMASIIRRSLLSSSALRKWLAEALTRKIPKDESEGETRTFLDVRRATGISLYVISMDLATGQPIIFSPDLTPTASVADAVIASSAIPVAFPSQRIEIDGEIRRIADGGVWANYPSFVFLDKDFRSSHDLDDGAESRDTVGFILDGVRPQQLAGPLSTLRPVGIRPLSNDHGAAEREFGLLGGLITSPATRAALFVLPFLLLVLGVSWFERELDNELPIIGKLRGSFQDLALVLLIVVFVFLLVQLFVLAFTVIRIGAALSDEGLVGARAAMGVGPNVPYWVGTNRTGSKGEPRHIAVRLRVPAGLGTLSSKLSDSLEAEVLSSGREQAATVLADAFSLGGHRPAAPPPLDAPAVRMGRLTSPLASVIVFWVGLITISGLSFPIIRGAAEDRVAWWQLITVFVVGLVLLYHHALRRSRRASLPETWLQKYSSGSLKAATVASLLIGLSMGLVLWFADGELREVSIRERMKAKEVRAVVIHAPDGAASTDSIDILIGPSQLDPFMEAGEVVAFENLDSETIGDCGEPAWCLRMPTMQNFDEVDEVTVRYAAQDGVLFFEQDRWTFGVGQLFVVLFLSPMALAYRLWHAYRWKQEHETDPSS